MNYSNNTQDRDYVPDEDHHESNNNNHHHDVFFSWDDVVRAHQHDMWSDIPAIVRHLGQNELDNIMEIYR